MLKMFLRKGKKLLNSIDGPNLFLLSGLLSMPVFIIVMSNFAHNLPREILAGFIVLGAFIFIFSDNKFAGKVKKGRLKRETANWSSLLSLIVVMSFFIMIDNPKWWLRVLEDLSLSALVGNIIILLVIFILLFFYGKRLNSIISNNYKLSKLTYFVSAVYIMGLSVFITDISQQELGWLITVYSFHS